MIIHFTTDAEMVGCLGFAPSSRRLRAGTSLSKFATLMAVCKNRDAKAELNRRSQICDVLTGTGVRVAEKRIPSVLEPASGLVTMRQHLRSCEGSAGWPDSLGKWTGMRVARPLLRFGRPACVSQHLCPKNWNPVLELHQLLRLCRPPPELLGQRGYEIKVRPETFASGRVD